MITFENTKTIRELLERAADEFNESSYLRYERGDEMICDINYKRFAILCRIVGAFVNEIREKENRQIKVALLGSSSVHYISVLIGVMASGNIAIPLDSQLDFNNVTDCLNRSDADILFYDWEYEPIINFVKEKCEKIRSYYSLQSVKKGPCLNDIFMNVKYTGKSWSSNEKEYPVAADDIAMVMFTSGTTGYSKGVMLTNGNLTGNVVASNPVDDKEGEVVYLNVLPIHHAFCINSDILLVMKRGKTLAINGSLSKLIKHLKMFNPSVIHMVPMIAKNLYNMINNVVQTDPSVSENEALHIVYGNNISRIVCGGGGLAKELALKYINMGVRIGQGYGMTECSPTISDPDYDRIDKIESVGKVRQYVKVRISEDREIQVCSPFVMKGYYNDPDITKEAFTDDGWLKTGDVGYIDEENYLFLTGRIKNLIILSNGENVAPEEIEAGFATEPLIEDIVVYGEEDIIKCEVYPNFKYAEKCGMEDIIFEVETIIISHNATLPSYKRIMGTTVRNVPFKKTTSKKIKREEFLKERKALEQTESGFNQPLNPLQQKVFDICAGTLGHRNFGVDTNLYTLGLDSLGSVILLTDLNDEAGISLTLTELMDNPTVEQICILHENKTKVSKVDYSVRESYQLTGIQMYFAYILRGNSSSNLPYFFKLGNNVSMDRLEEAFRKLFEIHPILKDRIEPGEDKYLHNFRDDNREVHIERLTLTKKEWGEKRCKLMTPFMYQPGEDLYHAGLYEVEDEKYIFFDLCHAIGDGTSMNILFEDLNNLYLGKEVKKLEYTFYEYILDEFARIDVGLRNEDIKRYMNLLEGFSIDRSLLAKKDCYDLRNAHSAIIKNRFFDIDLKTLQGFCKVCGVSENALFLSAFSYTAQLFAFSDDMVISSVHSGRTDGRWSRVCGALFKTFMLRYKKVPNETVEQLLKRNSEQILHTMESHTPCNHANEMYIQFQGDLLGNLEIGGEEAQREKVQLESVSFHLIVHSDKQGYRYELRYWENRFDRSMLEVFMTALENVLAAMLEETSVMKLKDYIDEKLYPKHFEISSAKLNSSLGINVVRKVSEDYMVKPYVLDEYGEKKPYGAWGKLYILDRKINGNGETINSLYTPGTMYDTGLIARITPDNEVETMEQAGKQIVWERNSKRIFVNLSDVEKTIVKYPGVTKADAYMMYGAKHAFNLKVDVESTKTIDEEKLKKFVEEKLGIQMVPDIININKVKKTFLYRISHVLK